MACALTDARMLQKGYLAMNDDFKEELKDCYVRIEKLGEAHRLSLVEQGAEINRLKAALEWALDKAATEHPHYPYRDGDKWTFPYLVDNAGGLGSGVGNAYFETALEAVERAAVGEK